MSCVQKEDWRSTYTVTSKVKSASISFTWTCRNDCCRRRIKSSCLATNRRKRNARQALYTPGLRLTRLCSTFFRRKAWLWFSASEHGVADGGYWDGTLETCACATSDGLARAEWTDGARPTSWKCEKRVRARHGQGKKRRKARARCRATADAFKNDNDKESHCNDRGWRPPTTAVVVIL